MTGGGILLGPNRSLSPRMIQTGGRERARSGFWRAQAGRRRDRRIGAPGLESRCLTGGVSQNHQSRLLGMCYVHFFLHDLPFLSRQRAVCAFIKRASRHSVGPASAARGASVIQRQLGASSRSNRKSGHRGRATRIRQQREMHLSVRPLRKTVL